MLNNKKQYFLLFTGERSNENEVGVSCPLDGRRLRSRAIVDSRFELVRLIERASKSSC